MDQKTKAAVLFISGQSNAHAHRQPLPVQDRITTPLKNVFSLDRDPNQSYDITDVVWSGFTSEGKNLGETQDHTCSFGYYFACLWQAAIDRGEELPDLYIVQMSIGAQGIINGMWNRDKEKILIPGPYGTANISLFSFSMHINRLVMANLQANGKEPLVLGWHWIGCEQDTWYSAFRLPDLDARYDYFFDSVRSSISEDCQVYLYELYLDKICSLLNLPMDANTAINRALYRQAARLGATLVKAQDCPHYDPQAPHYGIFAPDDTHYLAETQRWFALRFFEEIHAWLEKR